MKRKYITPQTTAFTFQTEGIMATSLRIGNEEEVSDRNEILSNKKENPIWGGGTNKGMWDNMD